MPIVATWIDLEIIILNDVRQRETDTIWQNLKHNRKQHIYETKTDSQK